MNPAVEVEEDVYAYENANNGATPQWCFGSPACVRHHDKVLATGLETIPDIKPLSNTRWTLLSRADNAGWRTVYRDTERTREPCPMGRFNDGRIFVTTNAALTPPGEYSGTARPELYEFDVNRPDAAPKRQLPVWDEKVDFYDHSYRSFAVDSANSEFVWFNNIGYDLAHWAFRDRNGNWIANGKIRWPRTDEYGPGNLNGVPTPDQPLRVCYPCVTLNNRAVHFFGVSDISEPNKDYNALKTSITGTKWDYIFCRMYYTCTPDITKQPFGAWVEVSSREAMRGSMRSCDLWLDPDGVLHLLWLETNLDLRLRDKYFPGEKLTVSLNYARMREGKEICRTSLIESREGGPAEKPEWGRFHVTPSGRLLVVATVTGHDAANRRVCENRVLEIQADGSPGRASKLTLEHPFKELFFTATPRGGSAPSAVLDLFGECHDRPKVIRYARVRVE